MVHLNIVHAKKCALCKYWYDPTNSAIKPREPRINLWTIDDKCGKKVCLKKSYEMAPLSFCSDFELKLEVRIK